MTGRRLGILLLVVAGLAVLVPGEHTTSGTSPVSASFSSALTPAHASANRARAARITALTTRLRHEASRVAAMEAVAHDLTDWLACLSYVGVDETGDPHHTWGFVYDERDGSGVDHRPALTIHRGRGAATWNLLKLSRRTGCESAPTVVGGTADAARFTPTAPKASTSAVRAPSDRVLARRASALRRTIDRLERRLLRATRTIDRFDEWESCLVWLPTTEDGDLDQDMGFRYDTGDGYRFRPAIGVDRTTWDDPDYQLIGFRSTALPFSRGADDCDVDPGESADRVAAASRTPAATPTRRRWIDRVLPRASSDISALREDLDDLRSPVEDFQQFDECMYTVGVSEVGYDGGPSGFVHVSEDGATSMRPALAFDMRGFTLPQMDLAAFPGEEPPQIECNEDAGGLDTDE